jgi:hypothetical protein
VPKHSGYGDLEILGYSSHQYGYNHYIRDRKSDIRDTAINTYEKFHICYA